MPVSDEYVELFTLLNNSLHPEMKIFIEKHINIRKVLPDEMNDMRSRGIDEKLIAQIFLKMIDEYSMHYM